MDAHNHPSGKLAVIAEIAAINIARVCGLIGFTAGLMTQNTGTALPGLAFFYATFFYALARVYHFRRTDHDVVHITHVDRRNADPFSWVDYLPKAASGRKT